MSRPLPDPYPPRLDQPYTPTQPPRRLDNGRQPPRRVGNVRQPPRRIDNQGVFDPFEVIHISFNYHSSMASKSINIRFSAIRKNHVTYCIIGNYPRLIKLNQYKFYCPICCLSGPKNWNFHFSIRGNTITDCFIAY